MGLSAPQFVLYKRHFVAEYARRGHLSLSDAKALLHDQLDLCRIRRLWEFCVLQGWVRAASQATN